MNLQARLKQQQHDDTYCDAIRLAVNAHAALLLTWGPEITDQIERNQDLQSGNCLHSGTVSVDSEGGLDQEWLSSFLLRWVLAEEFLALESREGLAEEHAVEVLIKRDIPALLSELARSRPDLCFRCEG